LKKSETFVAIETEILRVIQQSSKRGSIKAIFTYANYFLATFFYAAAGQ